MGPGVYEMNVVGPRMYDRWADRPIYFVRPIGRDVLCRLISRDVVGQWAEACFHVWGVGRSAILCYVVVLNAWFG